MSGRWSSGDCLGLVGKFTLFVLSVWIVGILFSGCANGVLESQGYGSVYDDPIYESALHIKQLWGVFIIENPDYTKWTQAKWSFTNDPMPSLPEGWICSPSLSLTWHLIEPGKYIGCCMDFNDPKGCDKLLINEQYGRYSGELVSMPWWALDQLRWDKTPDEIK